MMRSLWCGFVVAWSLALSCQTMFAQQAGDAQPASPPADVSLPPGEVPDVAVSARSAAGEEYTLPPELKIEADKAVAKFDKLHDELEQAMGDMRATYIRYLNNEDQSPEAQQLYRQQRDKVRKTMNDTYLAAMDVFYFMPHEPAAQYMATVIQHRFERDIYDETTMEGGAKLIDGGVQFFYIFIAAARSAVSAGNFQLAKRLYEAVDPEQLEDTDRALIGQHEELEANHKAEQLIREKEAAEDRLPRVLLKTTRGDVVLELFIDNAPSTVSNFIQLVDEGFYDGLDFYQVIAGLLALTGDNSGVGSGNSGRMLVDEHDRPDARKAFRGSLVMAKIPADAEGNFYPNSASSQFAILFLPQTRVSNQQTIFGRVIEGMDVITSMRHIDPSKEKKKGEIIVPPDRILTAEVIRRPEKLPEAVYVK